MKIIFISAHFLCLFSTSSTQCRGRLNENDICYTNDGVKGVCKTIYNCNTGLAAIKSRKRPKICSFDRSTPIICCNADEAVRVRLNLTDPTDIARNKCEEYAKSVFMEIKSPTGDGSKEKINFCARMDETLIVGGQAAKPKEYPHMALIGFGKTIPKWLCGGSLISERFVLSAAHCSSTKINGPAQWVRLGDLDITRNDDDAGPETIEITNRIVHPSYNQYTFYNDICLFKLARDVTFTKYIRPICLPTSSNIALQAATATGWGKTNWIMSSSSSPQGPPTSHLMKVKLDLVSNEYCLSKYRDVRGMELRLPEGIKESLICAGKEIGKDTCKGDSGGPLQIPLKKPYCMYDLIGLTSFGHNCADGYPGVFTRISYYLPWIVENVWTL